MVLGELLYIFYALIVSSGKGGESIHIHTRRMADIDEDKCYKNDVHRVILEINTHTL